MPRQEISQPDFTAHKFPQMVVHCPSCKKPAGVMCVRPSEHQATQPHAARGKLADELFIEIYGPDASIDLTPQGYVIDPTGYAKRLAREAKECEQEGAEARS